MALSYEKKVISIFRRITFHPLLFALYPVLLTYSVNMGKVREVEMILPGVISLVGAAAIWLLFWAFIRDRNISALCASTFLLTFALYQPTFAFIERIGDIKSSQMLHTLLLWISFAWIVAACFLIIRYKGRLTWVTGLLNSISLFVTLIVAVNITFFGSEPDRRPVFRPKRIEVSAPADSTPPPDIYFILLDGYGRTDVLKELYEFDNTWFIKSLQSSGFYVAEQAHANYGQTLLSLSSIFNMNYIRRNASSISKNSENRSATQIALFDNRLIPALQSLEYSFVTFSSGYSGTDFRNSDVRIFSPVDLTEFQNILLSQSPIPPILKRIPLKWARNFQYDAHRTRIKFILSKLPELSDIESPKFVFAHILSPHPPFVFGRSGEELSSTREFSLRDASQYIGKGSPDKYIKSYAAQAEHLSRLVLKAVKKIVDNDPDAIVIIHGDHGPGGHLDWESYERSNMRERWGILSAFRVPKQVEDKLYESISPVNTFRLILSTLFDADLPLLPDTAFFSTWSKPYDFREITSEVNPIKRKSEPSNQFPRIH